MANNFDARALTVEKHFELFERSADCIVILGRLKMEGVISRLETQRLQAERTQIERNRFVYINRLNYLHILYVENVWILFLQK